MMNIFSWHCFPDLARQAQLALLAQGLFQISALGDSPLPFASYAEQVINNGKLKEHSSEMGIVVANSSPYTGKQAGGSLLLQGQ